MAEPFRYPRERGVWVKRDYFWYCLLDVPGWTASALVVLEVWESDEQKPQAKYRGGFQLSSSPMLAACWGETVEEAQKNAEACAVEWLENVAGMIKALPGDHG